MSKGFRFQRGYNHAMGRKYDTWKDMYTDMKVMGLEPQGEVKKKPIPEPKLKSSTQKLLDDVYNRKGRRPGEKYISKMIERGCVYNKEKGTFSYKGKGKGGVI